MGDRCFLEMTIRREDLPKFARHVDAKPDEEWWDDLHDHPSNPRLVSVSVNEANYGWLDERQEAAEAGIPFFGSHDEGGCYGGYAFAAMDGEMNEAPLNHDGYLVIAVDDDLMPLDGIEPLRALVARRRAVERLFGLRKEDDDAEDDNADEPEGDPALPAGVRSP
jgi:hypothetical protein